MPIRKIENPVSISGRVGEIRAPIPPYVPNILRRFWERTRKLARRFVNAARYITPVRTSKMPTTSA